LDNLKAVRSVGAGEAGAAGTEARIEAAGAGDPSRTGWAGKVKVKHYNGLLARVLRKIDRLAVCPAEIHLRQEVVPLQRECNLD
jgi:hypothetical protein